MCWNRNRLVHEWKAIAAVNQWVVDGQPSVGWKDFTASEWKLSLLVSIVCFARKRERTKALGRTLHYVSCCCCCYSCDACYCCSWAYIGQSSFSITKSFWQTKRCWQPMLLAQNFLSTNVGARSSVCRRLRLFVTADDGWLYKRRRCLLLGAGRRGTHAVRPLLLTSPLTGWSKPRWPLTCPVAAIIAV